MYRCTHTHTHTHRETDRQTHTHTHMHACIYAYICANARDRKILRHLRSPSDGTKNDVHKVKVSMFMDSFKHRLKSVFLNNETCTRQLK